MRTISGAAALAAAGLTVALTGVAGASTPALEAGGGGKIVTCEDGKAVEREPSDEDRQRIKELRERAGVPDGPVRVEAEPGGEPRIVAGGPDGRSPEQICGQQD